TISNSTLSGNNATTEHGGGIYNDGALSGHATLMVSNSTLSGNSARFHGGSIYNDGARSGSATLTIGNTILNASGAENVYNDAGVIRSQGYNLNTQLRGIVNADGGTGDLNATGDQNDVRFFTLGPLAYNGGPTMTHALPVGSRAIDKGGNDATLNGTIDSSTTSIVVSNASPFPAGIGFVIQID